MKTEEELGKKMSGWYPTYRGKFLLLKSKTLTKEEFILYDGCIAFADWDKKNHPKTYGSFDLSQNEIEILLGCSEGYVSRHSISLYKLGLWKKRNDKRIQIAAFELIEAKLLNTLTQKYQIVDLQKYLAKSQNIIADEQEGFVNSQTVFSKENDDIQLQKFVELQMTPVKSDLISSKVTIFSFGGNNNIRNGDIEHTISADDEEWIKENIE